MIRVVLPLHLCRLAKVDGDVLLDVADPVTTNRILEALEQRYPMLCGTIRDHETRKRRPRVRFFAVEEDVTHQSPETPLPDAIAAGAAPFLIVGAVAGG
jgi:hypothetical protein